MSAPTSDAPSPCGYVQLRRRGLAAGDCPAASGAGSRYAGKLGVCVSSKGVLAPLGGLPTARSLTHGPGDWCGGSGAIRVRPQFWLPRGGAEGMVAISVRFRTGWPRAGCCAHPLSRWVAWYIHPSDGVTVRSGQVKAHLWVRATPSTMHPRLRRQANQLLNRASHEFESELRNARARASVLVRGASDPRRALLYFNAIRCDVSQTPPCAAPPTAKTQARRAAARLGWL